MKAIPGANLLSCLLITASALSGHCQTKPELVFTNKVATFTNLQGQTYRNANLIRVYSGDVIFKTNGDYGVVSITNLSKSTLEMLGVPSSWVEDVFAAEQRRKQALEREAAVDKAEQERLLNPSNLIDVRITSVLPGPVNLASYGNLALCNVSSTSLTVPRAYIARLPVRVGAYYSQAAEMEKSVTQMEANVAAAKTRLDQVQSQIDRQVALERDAIATTYSMYAMGPGSAVGQTNAVVQQALTEAHKAMDDYQVQLDAARAKLAALKEKELDATTLRMLPASRSHAGFPILICAPEQMQGAPDSNATPGSIR